MVINPPIVDNTSECRYAVLIVRDKQNFGLIAGGVVLGIFVGFILGNAGNATSFSGKGDFSGIESSLNRLNQDSDFYKHVTSYISLLNDDQYKTVITRYKKIGEEIEDQDSKSFKLLLFTMTNEVMNDEESNRLILELKDRVKLLKSEVKISTSDSFSRSTECASLVGGIKEQLAKDESFEFMFYSPNLNTCVYVTDYSFTSSGLSSKYYSESKYKVYNASTNALLKTFPHYYYQYPYLSKDEADASAEKGEKDFVKFVLENSGYNAELIKDTSLL